MSTSEVTQPTHSHDGCPLFLSLVPAGFPSPADEYLDRDIKLDALLIKNKSSTFFIRVSGHSMKDAGILNGDLLIIDRSLKASEGSIILAVVDGEFTVKRLHFSKGQTFLLDGLSLPRGLLLLLGVGDRPRFQEGLSTRNLPLLDLCTVCHLRFPRVRREREGGSGDRSDY